MAEMKPEIAMSAIKSNAATHFGYDPGTKTLAVTFKGGRTYRYGDVPPGIVDGLREAESKGSYIGRHIAGKFKVID